MRCGSGVAVETAHIDSWASSRCNHHHNLLRICSACHSEHDAHHSLPTEELRKLKKLGIDRVRANLSSRLNLQPHFPLPTPDPLFVGRAEELARIRDSLRTDRYLLVHGPGGIGKTQLVLRALQAAETGRPVLWVEAGRFDSVEALRAALEISLRGVKQAGSESLESALDKLQACLVIDGLELLAGLQLRVILVEGAEFGGGACKVAADRASSERLEEFELIGIVGGIVVRQWSHCLVVSADFGQVRALEPQCEVHEELRDLRGGLVRELDRRTGKRPMLGLEHGSQRFLRAAALRALAFRAARSSASLSR